MKKIFLILAVVCGSLLLLNFTTSKQAPKVKGQAAYWFWVTSGNGYSTSFLDNQVVFINGPAGGPNTSGLSCDDAGPYYCIVGFDANSVTGSGNDIHLQDLGGLVPVEPAAVYANRSTP